MQIKFDPDFMFGACTSAEQSEGYHENYKTNWDIFYQQDPKAFFDKVGPALTSQTFKKYQEDVKIYKQIGFGSFRTSMSWARIFPKQGVIDKKAITFYHTYIDELVKNKIKVNICLNHFDLPDWIVKMGGLENPLVADEFAKYAKVVLDEFGSKIDYLITFNEPVVPIVCGYLGSFHLPRVIDSLRAVKAAYGTILMHSKVVHLFNTQYRQKLKTKIGVIVNLSPALPKDEINFTKDDVKAVDAFNLLHNYALLDAMCKGVFSPELISILKKENLLIDVPQNELDIIKQNKLDFIGVNYYSPLRVEAVSEADKKSLNVMDRYAKTYVWKKARINPFRGWEILPEMLEKICVLIKERYNNIPFYISENGMGVEGEEKFRNAKGYIDDKYRIAFIQEHLTVLANSIKKHGVHCFGYHLWASIDCWSWLNAYKNRYGLVEVQIETGKRIFKESAYWYTQLCKEKAFDSNFKKIEEYIDIKQK